MFLSRNQEFLMSLLCKALWVSRKALYKCNKLLIIIIIYLKKAGRYGVVYIAKYGFMNTKASSDFNHKQTDECITLGKMTPESESNCRSPSYLPHKIVLFFVCHVLQSSPSVSKKRTLVYLTQYLSVCFQKENTVWRALKRWVWWCFF